MRTAIAGVSLLLLLTAAAAFADPTISTVRTEVVKSRRLEFEIGATLAAKGEILIEGDVNGRPVSMRKRVKAGNATAKFKVDPRKLKLRALGEPLVFNLEAVARETGGGEIRQSIFTRLAVPCIVLPGFGNENTPGSFGLFGGALQTALRGGGFATVTVHEYPSLTGSLPELGAGLEKTVRSALKGTPFAKVDLVGYSYGGLVARSFLAEKGGSRVRHCVFLGTPNEGAPVAYVAAGLAGSGQLDTYLDASPELAVIVDAILTPESVGALSNLYPTYSWATFRNPITQQIGPVPTFLLEAALGDSSTPLTDLNAVPPATGVEFHAFFYTSTGAGQFGTLDVVDLSAVLSGGTPDPATLAIGAGDGVAPVHSVTMEEVAAWAAVITEHELGIGTHVTLPLDPSVIAGVAAVLSD